MGQVVIHRSQPMVPCKLMTGQRIRLGLAAGADSDQVDVVEPCIGGSEDALQRRVKAASLLLTRDPFFCERCYYLPVIHKHTGALAQWLASIGSAFDHPEDAHWFVHLHGRAGQMACRVQPVPAIIRTNTTFAIFRVSCGSPGSLFGANSKSRAKAAIAIRMTKIAAGTNRLRRRTVSGMYSEPEA